jgi:hypothetical protein
MRVHPQSRWLCIRNGNYTIVDHRDSVLLTQVCNDSVQRTGLCVWALNPRLQTTIAFLHLRKAQNQAVCQMIPLNQAIDAQSERLRKAPRIARHGRPHLVSSGASPRSTSFHLNTIPHHRFHKQCHAELRARAVTES